MSGNDQQLEPGTMEGCRKLLQTFRTVMLTTITDDGLPKARPMAVQKLDELKDCDLWFVTADDSAKIGEVDHDRHVAVSCYRDSDGAWVSVSGTARHERDREEIKRLWKPDWKAWFPDGPDSPHICIVKVSVDGGEYWQQDGGKIATFAKMATAFLKREPADARLDPIKGVRDVPGNEKR